MSAPDFPIVGRANVASRSELVQLLADTRPDAVRLCGGGSSFARLPAPARSVLLLSMAPMQRIVRLDANDLTCSVEPGVERATLDAELARHRLVLPTPGSGTIGGLLARGEHQPLAPGALAARNIVLGLEGVTVDGLRFKVGARVVKSVAGFDVHRAFVGSRGRLLAATLIHLKLRPAPHATFAFAQGSLAPERALRLFRELRLLPTPPRALVLHAVCGGEVEVAGCVDGAREHVQAVRKRLDLRAAPTEPALELACPREHEVVDGTVQPSALPQLLAALPHGAVVRMSGTGQFLVALRPAASDALLAGLASLPGGAGEIRCGAPERRGRATAGDAGATRLEGELRRALDPRGILQ